MADKRKIKAFVQDVLGCGCAEEVFKIIELRQEEMAGARYDRVNIGNRLLIYIFRTDDPGFVGKDLAGIVRAGKEERNQKSFNRFRLVLASDDSRVGTAAMKAYKELDFTDDRTFLHVVNKEQVAF
ncbi:MAG TPA: hypothetical protein VGJ92_00515 [Methanocella sp.]|jgi:hypothetical protein